MPVTTTPTCKPLTSVTLPCPMCGQLDASIAVQLEELSEDGTGDEFFCRSCEGSFSRQYIHLFLARWPAIIAWVESVPQFPSEE